ncbi:MAG: hypothetical protein HY747_03560 [Elusimicrobia bacterium]|nr:hypothetical protein [Elusimicrobiota bacterium]
MAIIQQDLPFGCQEQEKNLGKKLLPMALAACLGAFLAQGIFSIVKNGATYDEPHFMAAGYTILKIGDFRLRRDKSLLSMSWLSLPLLFSSANFSE